MALVGGDTRGVSLAQLVQEATDELLTEPDYSKQLDIVERVQASGPVAVPGKCVEVAEAIASRLEKKKKSESVVYLSLHLADFCLKNITPQMGHIMGRDNFQKVIVKLAKGKTVKGRALVLLVAKVQEWAYLFQNHKGFQETYIALQKLGLEFPPPSRELMEAQSRINEQRIARMNERQARERAANDPNRKLRENLELLRDNVALTIDMISAVDPQREDVRTHELIPPLIQSIAQQRPKIAELIGTVADEDLLLLLLGINDDINSALQWYGDLQQGIKPFIPSRVGLAGASSVDEHDNGGSVVTAIPVSPSPAYAPPPKDKSPVAPDTPQSQSDDPFAALARARKAKDRRSAGGGSSISPTPSQQMQQQPAQGLSTLDSLFGGMSVQNSGPPPLAATSSGSANPYGGNYNYSSNNSNSNGDSSNSNNYSYSSPVYAPAPAASSAAPPPYSAAPVAYGSYPPPPVSNPYASGGTGLGLQSGGGFAHSSYPQQQPPPPVAASPAAPFDPFAALAAAGSRNSGAPPPASGSSGYPPSGPLF